MAHLYVVAVRIRAHRPHRANGATGTQHIFNDELLAKCARHVLADNPSGMLSAGLGILSSDVRFDQFELRSRRDTPAVEHGRDWKQSLTAGAPALIVVEEFEASFPQFHDCDIRRRSDIQRARSLKASNTLAALVVAQATT
jgi:hypothetical protein